MAPDLTADPFAPPPGGWVRVSPRLAFVRRAIGLAIVLPLCGVHLPLVKTMIAVTFIAGLVPLAGNLISNTVIVVVSLSHSLGAAAGSLVYLVTIHKLEYLVNAKIIGTEIRARSWELLLAMLAMEAAFGLPGLVAAPVYYGYLKDELAAQEKEWQELDAHLRDVALQLPNPADAAETQFAICLQEVGLGRAVEGSAQGERGPASHRRKGELECVECELAHLEAIAQHVELSLDPFQGKTRIHSLPRSRVHVHQRAQVPVVPPAYDRSVAQQAHE